jgi:hypothetical protein
METLCFFETLASTYELHGFKIRKKNIVIKLHVPITIRVLETGQSLCQVYRRAICLS